MRITNHSNTLVSVIIPTYNRSKEYLKTAIDSIVNQENCFAEIIIVDDNGVDSIFADEIKNLIAKYKNNNIKLTINEENKGGAISRNIGVKIANSKYVTFLDDDDIYLPNKLNNQIDFMEKENLDMSFGDLIIKDEKEIVVDYRSFDNLNTKDNKKLMVYHLKHNLTGTPTFMLTKKAFEEIGGFDDVKMGQEFYLMYKAIKGNLKIGYLKEANVIAYRHTDGGISFGINKIEGEQKLFKFKMEHEDILSKKDIRYIKFRHNVVMAIAYKRNSNYFKFLIRSLKSALFYPIYTTKEVFKKIRNIKKIKEKRNLNDII